MSSFGLFSNDRITHIFHDTFVFEMTLFSKVLAQLSKKLMFTFWGLHNFAIAQPSESWCNSRKIEWKLKNFSLTAVKTVNRNKIKVQKLIFPLQLCRFTVLALASQLAALRDPSRVMEAHCFGTFKTRLHYILENVFVRSTMGSELVKLMEL